MTETYRRRHEGWSAKHFYAWYRRDGGSRSYTWVKSRLQNAGLAPKAKARGAHRKRRDRSPWPGLMIHQDGSGHEGVPGQRWDLIVTMDDATSEHYAMFFVAEKGTMSSLGSEGSDRIPGPVLQLLLGSRESLLAYAGSGGQGGQDAPHPIRPGHATPGHRDDSGLFARSPGRSERMFRNPQERLPRELALAGITDMAAANRYLAETYRPAFNSEFMQPAMEDGSAFVAWIGGPLEDILGERFERQVGADNCVSFAGMKLQIPADRHRCHYVKAKVAVLRRIDGTLAIFHGPRKLADYAPDGRLRSREMKAVT